MESFIEGQPLKRELEGSLKTQIHEVYKTNDTEEKETEDIWWIERFLTQIQSTILTAKLQTRTNCDFVKYAFQP